MCCFFLIGCLNEFGGGARLAPINRYQTVQSGTALYNFEQSDSAAVEINVALNKHKFLVTGMILGILIPFLYVIFKSYMTDTKND